MSDMTRDAFLRGSNLHMLAQRPKQERGENQEINFMIFHSLEFVPGTCASLPLVALSRCPKTKGAALSELNPPTQRLTRPPG